MSLHNLFIGTPYMDISGKPQLINMKTGEYAQLEFFKRGWTGKGFKA